MTKKIEQAILKGQSLQGKQTAEIRLKSKVGPAFVHLDLKQAFGFIPDDIIIKSVPTSSRTIVVFAPFKSESFFTKLFGSIKKLWQK